jgi:hypothetical protein
VEIGGNGPGILGVKNTFLFLSNLKALVNKTSYDPFELLPS